MAKNFIYKDSEAAFEVVKEFFEYKRIERFETFIGLVRGVDQSSDSSTDVWEVEITCLEGVVRTKEVQKIVAGVIHPDLNKTVQVGDLVHWGADQMISKIPTGFIIEKLSLEYDNDNRLFLPAKETPIKQKPEEVIDTLDAKSDEELKNYSKVMSKMTEANSLWKTEIDHKYGLILPKSEIIEDDKFIYYCQTDMNKRVAGWNKAEGKWKIDVDRQLLEGLSFSTPKRFEDVVFPDSDQILSCSRKQYLLEYLLFGLSKGSGKTLSFKTNNEGQIEFTLESAIWNEMLIGNPVGIENGLCKYTKKDSSEEQFIKFGLICNEWMATVEIVFDEYDNFEQHEFGIKQFKGYYL